MKTDCRAKAAAAGFACLPAIACAHAAADDAGLANAGAWLLLALAATAYAAGWHVLRQRTTKAVPITAATCFASGWLLALGSLASPLDRFASEYFWVHMVQHELLMLLCAPLMVLGRPGIVWLWSLPASLRQATGRLLRRQLIVSAWRFASRPSGAALLHAMVVWGWHLPLAFESALQNASVHALQHLSFVLSAALFWHAVLVPTARKADALSGLLWVFLTCVHTSLLGALLLFSVRPWYPMYADAAAALDDQRLGGIIMWVPGSLAYLVAVGFMMRRLLEATPAGRHEG